MKAVFPLNTPRRSRIVETIDCNLEKGTISYLHKPFILDELQNKELNWDKKQEFLFKNFKTGEYQKTEGYITSSMFYVQLVKINQNLTKVSQIFSMILVDFFVNFFF